MNKADLRFNVAGVVWFAFWVGYFARAEYVAFPEGWRLGLWLFGVIGHFLPMLMFLTPLLRANPERPLSRL